MSFNIANSGLNAITEQLNSISNNIANSGTVGYKSSRAEFSSIYAQSQPLGVSVTGVTQSISRGGSISNTGNALDLAIGGNGFFVVQNASGESQYTRAGYFGFDAEGNIANNMGSRLQGYPVDANGNIQSGTISDLKVSNAAMPAKASDQLDFSANLDARSEVPSVTPFDPDSRDSYNETDTVTIHDSLGREHTVTQYFVKTGDNEWKVYYSVDGNSTGTSTDLEFDKNGVMIAPTGKVNLSAALGDANDISLDIDYAGTSQFGSDFNVSTSNANGYASASRKGVQIDKDGSVYATYTNGERMLQGQVVLANFPNINGLKAEDGTVWSESSASGSPIIGTAGTGLFGSIQAGALEGSNVDLTAELVGLMTAQRNYQANTKVISTNDNMMQSLFQAV